jgi:menaquinone-specific isochorismate synthase
MSDSASHSTSGLPPDDRRLAQPDLYLKIATQMRHFFECDLHDLPPEIEGKILRVEVQIPPAAPLSWLARQETDVKTYWSDRESDFSMAGVGVADIIAGDTPISYPIVFDRLRQLLSPLFPRIRYYGGIGFSQDRSLAQTASGGQVSPLATGNTSTNGTRFDPSWQLFGNYRFIVPKFEMWTDGINTYFACNFRWNVDNHIDRSEPANPPTTTEQTHRKTTQAQALLDPILQELARLNFTQTAIDLRQIDRGERDLPLLIDRVDNPHRLDWHQNIDSILAKFADLQLEKIVLARQSTLTFTKDLQPQLLLLLLQPQNLHSYHFCFQINPQIAFIGTSPERLYYRHDRFLKTEALAGTRHRGGSSQLDRALSNDLRNSAKDIREHQLVVNNVRATLTELCDSVTIDRQLTILKLNKVQHLYTQYSGTLKPDLTDAEILPQLHPTPAVGGFPRYQALQSIDRIELFERGWYAAPVGWVSYAETEFAVAIRSGLIDGNRLLLFAGAGIVRGSQAEEEWAEIENKIRHFTDLFTNVSIEVT